MDTRWRSKVFALIWLLLVTYGFNSFIVGIPAAPNYINNNYFETDLFYRDLERFATDLNEHVMFSKDEAVKNITVSDEEIREHRYRYGELTDQIKSIRTQYETNIQEAKKANLNDLVTKYEQERDKKIEDIMQNFASDDYVRSKVIAEKEQAITKDYEESQHRLSSNHYSYIEYFLEDPKTGKSYTNQPNIKDIAAFNDSLEGTKLLFSQTFPNNSTSRYNRFMPSVEGKIVITEESVTNNVEMQMYHERRTLYFIQMITGLISLITSLFLYRYVRKLILQFLENNHSILKKIPIDVCIGILLLSIAITLDTINPISDFVSLPLMAMIKSFIISWMISVVFTLFIFIQLLVLINHFRHQSEPLAAWKTSFISKLICAVRNTFLQQKIGLQLFFLLGVVYAGGFGICVVLFHPNTIVVYLGLFILIFLPVLYIFFKHIGYYNQIKAATDELIKGNYNHQVPIKGKTTLTQLAKNINILKEGMKSSQKEQAKSERLKTELISNVSHDLRTPLTSIITYTDLLKKENLTKEEQVDYITIIDQKSQRLKLLIEDLFEVSKMSSGNIKLQCENIDVVQLLQQALAELDEKIQASSLQFRFKTQKEHIDAFIDGQKMWRVFDNLINNTLKYSLEHTRVYISVTETENNVSIFFKNISAFELGDNIEELFQRFKRGDESRHTEGSGLGLAIAKSIVDLHDGELHIDVDGDLFKITITLDKKKD